MNIPTIEGYKKAQVVGKCWEYLLDNFHKFSDANRLKVSLAICTKDMPTEHTGKIEGLEPHILIIERDRVGEPTTTTNRLPTNQTTDLSIRPAD